MLSCFSSKNNKIFQEEIIPDSRFSTLSNFPAEIKPVFILLRLTGKFPYYISDEGYSFSMLSIPTAYTLIFYFFKCLVSGISAYQIINKKFTSAATFDEAIFWSGMVFLTLMDFLCPIIYWIEAPKVVSFMNKWKYFKVVKENEIWPRRVKHIAYMIIPFSALLITIDGILEMDFSLYIFIQLIPNVADCITSLLFFAVSLWELEAIASQSIRNLRKVETKTELALRRHSWVLSIQMVSELGQARGLSFLACSGVPFIMSLSCASGFPVGTVGLGERYMRGLIFGGIACFGYNFLLCNIAHKTLEKIEDEVITEILTIDLRRKPPFFKDELIQNVFTYLIVLQQFKITAPSPMSVWTGNDSSATTSQS